MKSVKNAVGKTIKVANHVNLRHQNASLNNHDMTCRSFMDQFFLIDPMVYPNTFLCYCWFVISVDHYPFGLHYTPGFKLF